MDATREDTSQIVVRLQKSVTLAWYALRSPKLTGSLVVILAVVTLLGLLFPQQPTTAADASAWISSLLPLVQLWGELLYFLGFARIFQSLLFWVPTGLLLLNSLIALADYLPGSWQRLRPVVPPIDWQHPLSHRTEHIVRLPRTPDEFLTSLQTTLAEHGFFLYHQPVESEQRIIGAARRRWAWLGIIGLYVGLILVVVALLVSHYFLQTERFTLFPGQPKSSHLWDGEFELAQVGTRPDGAHILFWPASSEGLPLAFSGGLFQPVLFNKVLFLPVAREPILVVEARNSSDEVLSLIPLQEDLPPAKRLSLPLAETGTPLYFSIPSAKLAIQILPDPDSSSNEYNVQVRRSSDEAPSENVMVQAGETFELDDLFVTISPDHNLNAVAFFDPALPLYLLSVVLIVGGSLLTFVRFFSPVQLWLVPEVKGLGGQLYGVAELYGSVEKANKFLDQLLSPNSTQEDSGKSTSVDETQASPDDTSSEGEVSISSESEIQDSVQ